MNVLVTCAGRRTQMVQFLREALHGHGQVVAADVSADAPALDVADVSVTTPSVDDPAYLSALLEVCRVYHIGLLIPCLEPELPGLATTRDLFRETSGTVVLVSSREIVELCYDKLATQAWLGTMGVAVPQTYATFDSAVAAVECGELAMPAIVKPRWGTTSFGLELVHDVEELELVHRLLGKRLGRGRSGGAESRLSDPAILTQEWLDGIEYGLDVLNDLDGNHSCTFAKRKLRMRAGQTDRAVTVRDPDLERLGGVLGRLGHVGLLDCDVIVTSGDAYVIDLNPRFGGGYPFSHVAGANALELIVGWLSPGRVRASPHRLTSGMTLAKRDEVVVIADHRDESAAADMTA